MTTTPRTMHAQDLVGALKDQGVALGELRCTLEEYTKLQRKHILELEKLQARHKKEAEDLANGGVIDSCEMCQTVFVRSREDVKNFEFQCLDCRPAPKCSECRCELEEGEEGMCSECSHAFNF